MHLNILKAYDNGSVTDVKPGDKVRIDDTSHLKKGTESRWSDEAQAWNAKSLLGILWYGDKVRIDDTSQLKKGTESRWSDEAQAWNAKSLLGILWYIEISRPENLKPLKNV